MTFEILRIKIVYRSMKSSIRCLLPLSDKRDSNEVFFEIECLTKFQPDSTNLPIRMEMNGFVFCELFIVLCMAAVFILKDMNIHFRGILGDSNVIYLWIVHCPTRISVRLSSQRRNFFR